ncbi:hypothetical protein DFH11DRAFT_1608113, partial [Phellopilus nigrolimitatus]
MTSDVPPSYESVVARFEKHLGSNPKPQEVLNAIEQLPQYEIDIIVSNAHEIPAVTAEQKAAFTLGVAKTMTSPEAAEHLKNTATKESAACKAIETMFTKLTVELAKIDAKNMPSKEGAFVPRFELLNQDYHQIVHRSRDLAVEISVYGQQFDMIIVPICNDKSLTTKLRVAKVTKFIKDADTFSKASDVIKDRLDKLKVDFIKFTSSFGSWASGKEGADTKELDQARKDLEKLKNNISVIGGVINVAGWLTGGSLLVTGIFSLMTGPIVPFLIIGGMTVAAIGDVTCLGLLIADKFKKEQVSTKQAKIDALVQSINNIKATREKLERLGTDDLELFINNISIIAFLWERVHNDALEIKKWLERGAEDADMPMPEYMLTSVNESVRIYKTMAGYLRQYADGIASVNVPLV